MWRAEEHNAMDAIEQLTIQLALQRCCDKQLLENNAAQAVAHEEQRPVRK